MSERQIALITGGAKRIGAQISNCLHEAGLDVLIHCNRSRSEAEEKADELNALRSNSASVIQCDLSDSESISAMTDELIRQYPELSVLVNNASIFFPATVEETSRQQWQTLQLTNAEAPYFLTQALAPTLAQNNGSVVNITDIHAEIPLRNYSAYCASKAALLSMTRSLALELAPNLRVNAVAPGAIFWPENNGEEDNEAEYSEAAKQNILRRIPLAQLGSAKDIAKAVRFLVLEAPYITGQVINVDGGRSLSA